MREVSSRGQEYNGTFFRSRTEARWVVFFDHLGICWEYEPKSFYLPPKRYEYIPDFLITMPGEESTKKERQYWIEVKPFEPTAKQIWKAETLSKVTSNPVLILYGIPNTPWKSNKSGVKIFIDGDGDPYDWAVGDCMSCGVLDFYRASEDAVCLHCNAMEIDFHSDRLLWAYGNAIGEDFGGDTY